MIETYTAIPIEELAKFRHNETIPVDKLVSHPTIVISEEINPSIISDTTPQGISEQAEIGEETVIFSVKMKRNRESSGLGEATYSPASRQDIRTTEGEITKRRADITERIMEMKDLRGMVAFGFVSTVVFEQRRTALHQEIKELGGQQKLDRDRIRPSKISFRNGPAEKAKRQQKKQENIIDVMPDIAQMPVIKGETPGQMVTRIQHQMRDIKLARKAGKLIRKEAQNQIVVLHTILKPIEKQARRANNQKRS